MAKDVLVKINNNATGTLAVALGISGTSLQLQSGQGSKFPTLSGSEYFYVTLVKNTGDWEIVKVTAVSGDQFTTIVRNIESSTGSAQAFSIDDKVALRVCKQVFQDMITEIEKTELIAPIGTKMYFYQNVAPTGWTIDSAVADKLLAVKGGSNAYNVAGGTMAGTWTQPNHTHNMKNHTHTGGSYALTAAQMPVHNHSVTGGSHGHTTTPSDIYYGTSSSGVYGKFFPGGYALTGVFTIGGGSHSHTVGNAGSGSVHSHGATSVPSDNTSDGGATANTYRPYGAVGIVATKD